MSLKLAYEEKDPEDTLPTKLCAEWRQLAFAGKGSHPQASSSCHQRGCKGGSESQNCSANLHILSSGPRILTPPPFLGSEPLPSSGPLRL